MAWTEHLPALGPARLQHVRMMWLMCLPMVVFAIVLMTTTSAGAAVLLPTLLCVAMMALMMGMHGRNGGH